MFQQYKFTNQLGTVYKQGDLLFSRDGGSVYVPVGNKVTCYNLRQSNTYTLPVEVDDNFTSLAMSPDGLLLLAATDTGSIHLISTMRRLLLFSERVPSKVSKVLFSPDGKRFAIAASSSVIVYTCDGMKRKLSQPFKYLAKFEAESEVLSIDWSFDSKFLAYGCADGTAIVVWPKQRHERFMLNNKRPVLGNHAQPLIGVFFLKDSYDIYIVGRTGGILRYKCGVNPDELEIRDKREQEDSTPIDTRNCPYFDYRCIKKTMAPEYLNKTEEDATAEERIIMATGVSYHAAVALLVIAFANGRFYVIRLHDELDVVHSLHCTTIGISSIAVNCTAEWVALGVPTVGQFFVWELKSETYVLKQQGHADNMSVVAYSPDGSCMASGGSDGKVKMWSTQTSYCYVTFQDHTDAVTGVVFTQSGRAVLSSSMDGTVRAFDLTRYRTFKTLTATSSAAQFSCVSVNSDGELVVAAAVKDPSIYLWSLKKGCLLEVLRGHTAPVASICFSPVMGSSMMASTAGDNTVMLWSAIETTKAKDTVELSAEGVCVAIRPDGEQVCVSTADGKLTLLNAETGKEEATIEGKADLGLEEGVHPKRKDLLSKYFRTVRYTSDGEQLLAGGVSKHLCVYSVRYLVLIAKFQLTMRSTYQNRESLTFQGWRKKDAAVRNAAGLEVREQPHKRAPHAKEALPGVASGDRALRTATPVFLATDVAIAPSGRSFSVCSSEGLRVYSRSADWRWDPLALHARHTPAACRRLLTKRRWTAALCVALRLNLPNLACQVLETIPVDSAELVIGSLPSAYLQPLLDFLASCLYTTRHLGTYVQWLGLLLGRHGLALKARPRALLKTISDAQTALGKAEALTDLMAANEQAVAYVNTLAATCREEGVKVEDKEEDEDLERMVENIKTSAATWMEGGEEVELELDEEGEKGEDDAEVEDSGGDYMEVDVAA